MGEPAKTGQRPLISPRYAGRLLQTAFLGVFLFGTVVIAFVRPEVVLSARYGIAAMLVFGATALPFLPSFGATTLRPWMMLMPALDYVAFIVIRSEGLGGATNPLVMALTLPAIWIGLQRSTAALLAFLPLPFGVIVPDVVRIVTGVLNENDAARAVTLIVIFPLIMLIAAVLARVMASTLAARQAELAAEQEARIQAAMESESTRRLLDAVVDSLDVGVIVLSAHGEPVLMNRVLRESPELLEQDADPWTALSSVRAFAMDRVSAVHPLDSILRQLRSGRSVRDELVWVGSPGSEQRALSLSASLVETGGTEELAAVIVVRDVTTFVRALESKDVFIATVSHELRTPLTTIAGFLELIDEHRDALDPSVVGWLAIIKRNVERQQLVVRDLLAAASARSTKLAVSLHDADLGRVAAEAAIAIGPEADQKHIVIGVRALPTPGRFDPLRMAQVAENLLSNAVRYTPDGGSVSIQTRDAGDALELIVRDTGIGIAEDEQKLLFDEFFRGMTARSSTIRGVGLGLAVVRSIVDAHNGTIDLESEVGKGTTVTVRIPRG